MTGPADTGVVVRLEDIEHILDGVTCTVGTHPSSAVSSRPVLQISATAFHLLEALHDRLEAAPAPSIPAEELIARLEHWLESLDTGRKRDDDDHPTVKLLQQRADDIRAILTLYAASRAEIEGLKDQHERAEMELIDARDAAEEAFSQAYYLIIGRSPEWSNLFGAAEALEEIAKNEADYIALRTSAEAALAEKAGEIEGLKAERNGLIKAVGEHVTVRSDYLHRAETAEAQLLKDVKLIEKLNAEANAEREKSGRLETALGWFLYDERFQVAVGGNPNVVDRMLRDARAALCPKAVEEGHG